MHPSATTALAVALAVPTLMALACARYVRRRRVAAAALGDAALVARIADDLHGVPWRRIASMLTAALLLGGALLHTGGAATEPPAGRDVVLVLDASNSMRVEDVVPSRLEQQRRLAHRLLAELEADRVGLVAFAGEASVLAPPTADHGAIRMYIDAVHPEIAVQTGSAIGAGIRQASSLLARAPAARGTRLIVLVSDGEVEGAEADTDAPIEAARRAGALGMAVHTVGIGTAGGGRVPFVDPETGQQRGYYSDPGTGAIAVSALDEALLREIAAEADGSYHHLTDGRALGQLLAAVGASRMQPDGFGGRPPPPFVWLAIGAILLIAADAVAERRRR